jgi:hypothetical protein
MATTWIKPIHAGNSIAATLKLRTEYAKNPDKTDGGEYIAAFDCDGRTADADFLLSKRLYEQQTGRSQGKHDVLAYHIRQSFKPGEVTPEEALKIGYDLALRWTKGRHQFIVAAHTIAVARNRAMWYNERKKSNGGGKNDTHGSAKENSSSKKKGTEDNRNQPSV